MDNGQETIGITNSLEQQGETTISEYYGENDNDDNLCVACRKHIKDTTESKYSGLCTECRSMYIKYPISKWVYGMLIGIAVLFMISMVKIPVIISDYKIYKDSKKDISNKEYFYASKKLSTLLGKYKGSVPLAIELMDVYMKQQLFSEAAQIFDNNIRGEKLKEEDYKVVSDYTNKLTQYFTTYSEIDKILKDTNINVQNEKLTEMLKKDVDKTQVYFCLAIINSGTKKYEEYLKLASDADPEYTYPLAFYGNALRSDGKYDEAENVYERALEFNKNDAFSIRGISIIRLLEGKNKEALVLAQKSYEISPKHMYIPESLAIALCENNKREEALNFINRCKNEGYTFAPDMDEYLSGKMNLVSYYTE